MLVRVISSIQLSLLCENLDIAQSLFSSLLFKLFLSMNHSSPLCLWYVCLLYCTRQHFDFLGRFLKISSGIQSENDCTNVLDYHFQSFGSL